MKIEVNFPDHLLTTLEREPDSFRQQTLIAVLGTLYQAGYISGGIGAQIMGCNRWEFYERLSEQGFAAIDYPDEELEQEAKVDSIWYERVRKS